MVYLVSCTTLESVSTYCRSVFNIDLYSGPPLIRSPLALNENLALLEEWPLVRGILNTFIQSLFSEIMKQNHRHGVFINIMCR